MIRVNQCVANQAQPRRRPVIRVFVSSTFTDLKHERDALQRDVFPKLEQLCASRQFQFHAIDLRWGVPTEASLDHRTMRICFEELRRSQEISPQPNFLILLGNRYGWRPLPEEVFEDEFRKLEQFAPSGSDLEILRAWYRRDENAVPPVYLLHSRKQNLNDGRDYTNDQVWHGVQRVLWDIINYAYPAAQLAGRFDHPTALDEPLPSIVRFQASATEQEIWRGALGAPNAHRHVLVVVRQIENVEEFRPFEIRDFVDLDESGAINAVSQGALRELKQELRKRLEEVNVIEIEHARLVPTANEKRQPTADVTTGHLEKLCARVHAALKDIITRQMDEYWGTSDPTVAAPRELDLERGEHQRFGQERAPADSFVGRERHLQAIHAYLHNNSNQPLVIHGASGCGKTALMARAAHAVVPELKPVVRFVGVTPRSSDVRSLLASLCQELRQRHPLESPIPGDIRELTKELDEHFKTTTAQAPLILFLDALDQLADADNYPSLFWIPQLPGHVKLIASCLSDRAPEDPASQPYAAFKRGGLAEGDFIDLDALSEEEAQTLFFERWLTRAGRKLNAKQIRCIGERLTSDACRQPLYLKLLFEEARLWRSDDPAPTLGSSVSELLGTLLKRLGDPSNHGPTLECALGYIAAAHRGLTEMEILEVLYQDPDYAKFLEQMTARTGHMLPNNPKRIPIVIWSRLRLDLSPYLAEHAAPGGTVLTFYHRQVAEFVRDQFLDTSLKRQNRHERLAGYFDGQDYFLESLEEQRARVNRLPPTPRPANKRKVDELPWQRLEAAKLLGKWDTVETLFSDLFFAEAKTEAGFVFDLAGDFAEAIMSMPAERPSCRIFKLMEEALRRDIHFIARHPTTLFQCLWNLCWWYDAPAAETEYLAPASGWTSGNPPWKTTGAKLHILLETWRTQKELQYPGFAWVRSLRPPFISLDSPQRMVLRGHKGKIRFLTSSEDGRALVSEDPLEMKLWSLQTGNEIRSQLLGKVVDSNVGRSPDQTKIAIAQGRVVNIEDATTQMPLYRLEGHPSSSISAIEFSLDGQLLASGDMAGEIRIWDAYHDAPWVNPPLTQEEVREMISEYGGGGIFSHPELLPRGGELKLLNSRSGGVTSLAWSKCGRFVAAGHVSGKLVIWDKDATCQFLTIDAHTNAIGAVTFSSNGSFLASGSADKESKVWSFPQGNLLRTLRGHREAVTAIKFMPDDGLLATGSADLSVRIWDFRSGSESYVLPSASDPIGFLALSGDGLLIATGSRWNTNVTIFDRRHWNEIRQFKPPFGNWLRRLTFVRRNNALLLMIVSFSHDAPELDLLFLIDPYEGHCVHSTMDEGSFLDRIIPSDQSSSKALRAHIVSLPDGPTGFESRLIESNPDKPLAWFPVGFSVTTCNPIARTWAASDGEDIYLLEFEGQRNEVKTENRDKSSEAPIKENLSWIPIR